MDSPIRICAANVCLVSGHEQVLLAIIHSPPYKKAATIDDQYEPRPCNDGRARRHTRVVRARTSSRTRGKRGGGRTARHEHDGELRSWPGTTVKRSEAKQRNGKECCWVHVAGCFSRPLDPDAVTMNSTNSGAGDLPFAWVRSCVHEHEKNALRAARLPGDLRAQLSGYRWPNGTYVTRSFEAWPV